MCSLGLAADSLAELVCSRFSEGPYLKEVIWKVIEDT